MATAMGAGEPFTISLVTKGAYSPNCEMRSRPLLAHALLSAQSPTLATLPKHPGRQIAIAPVANDVNDSGVFDFVGDFEGRPQTAAG